VLTERSAERCEEARRYLERGGFSGRVRIETDDGLAVLDRIDGEFDIVFNDIDKRDYPRVLDGAARVLRRGGLLISDNMLWSGKVLDDDADDAETLGVKELTRRLLASESFETVLLPVRDGVAVALRGG
jgi:predicted O-methyltransferase YrrM